MEQRRESLDMLKLKNPRPRSNANNHKNAIT